MPRNQRRGLCAVLFRDTVVSPLEYRRTGGDFNATHFIWGGKVAVQGHPAALLAQIRKAQIELPPSTRRVYGPTAMNSVSSVM